MDGRRRFEFQYDDDGDVTGLIQRSIIDPKLEWQVSLVKQAVTPGPHFNARAARAKLMSRSGADDGSFAWGPGVPKADRAHGRSEGRRVGKERVSTWRVRWSPDQHKQKYYDKNRS